MRKITTIAFATLGLSTSTLVNAAEYSASWESNAAPTKASYTMTLSGECSGKITQVVDTVYISYGYETDAGGQLLRNESHQSVTINGVSYGDDYFYAEAYGSNYVSADKFSEIISKGKKTISFTLTQRENSYPRVWPISSESQFSSQIKCKNGATLQQVLDNDWSLYINDEDPSFKPKTTVKLTTSLSNPNTADYTVTQTFSGIARQKSLCTSKGTIGTEGSSVSCGQPKPIKVSVKLSAQGTASLVP